MILMQCVTFGGRCSKLCVTERKKEDRCRERCDDGPYLFVHGVLGVPSGEYFCEVGASINANFESKHV